MDPHVLYLEPTVAEVVAYALQRTIDDLEARAIVAAHHDPALGPASAAGYRVDIRRLTGVLDQLAAQPRDPDPHQAAIGWIDGTYTIVDGHPVRMCPQPDPQPDLATVRPVDTSPDPDQSSPGPNEATATRIVDPQLPTPKSAHRLAPRCEPHPDRGDGRDVRPC